MKVISTKIIKGKKHYLIDDEEKPLYQSGGVIEDDRGQWAYPGEVTKINSPNITMKGVPYPVLGVSDAGDTQLMQPNGEYTFRGNNVTEYPIKAQRGANVEFSEDYVLDDHKQFLKNWYQNRIINDPQFQKGFIEDKKEINKKLNSFPEYKYEGDNYISKKGKGVITGYYDPSDKTIKLARKAPKFTKTHELDHYISDAPLYSNTSNETVINNEIIPAKQREGNYKDSYYSDPNEVHARLMVLRKAAKLKPDEFVTPERLGKFFENYKPGDNENIDDLINIMKDHKGLLNMLNYTSDNLDSSKKIIKAQKGYNVPIQGINSSDNTRTKLTPKTELIPQQLQQIVNSQTSVKAMADKVSLEKATRLKKADVAYKKRQETGMQSSEDLADETGAIGDKISLQNLPKIGKYIPDMLDATGMIGNMASGLGKIPLNLEQRNYGQAALSVAMPLGLGALAGIGNPNTGQFANNLINPFVGTGQIVNKLGNKYLPNAHKLNPFVFKPDPEAFYRQVGKSAYDDAITKGKVFSNGQENMLERVPELNYLDEYNKSIALDKTGKFNLTKPSEAPFVKKGELFFPINRKPTGKGYKGTKYADAEYLLEGKLPNEAVLPRYQEKYFPTLKESSNVGVIRPEFNELNNFNVYKRDWLKGYKQIDVPKPVFKSEIDWAKWNKEIPENKALMQEYRTIEQQAKTNGTWMKNPDGSAFQGTPEQFVQQNSQNFKKAFPEGSENVFRGTGENIAELRPNRSIFTANQELASGYAPFNKKSIFLNSESGEGGVHSFYRKNSKNSLELDANNTSWTSVDLSNKRLTKDYFERNIKSQEDQITKQKEYLSKMKQNPNGSWEAPDGTTYSNDLYKNTVAERELYLKDLKERYKNIDNLISNPKELEEMRKVLGNTSTTDDIATYVEKRNLDYVKLKNIEDSGVGDVTIVNHKPGNYLKSAIGNNGMFDMTNPNIYKTVVGALATGALGKQTMKKQEFGGKIKILKTKISNGKTLHLIDY